MHLYPVVEVEYYQSFVPDFAACDFRIHNVIETRGRPLALFPVGQQFAVMIEVHRGLDGKINWAERELKVELPDPYLCSEFSDNGGQVKLFGYSVHIH